MAVSAVKMLPAYDADLPLPAQGLQAWSWMYEVDSAIDALPKRSGERTRLRLIKATAELMAHQDAPTRAAVINRQARTAQGTFYGHFEDAQSAEREVLKQLLNYREARLPQLDGKGKAFDGVFSFIDAYTRVYAANADLFRGIIARVDRDPDFALCRQHYNMKTIERILNDVRKRDVSTGVSDDTLELSVWTAGTLLEDSLYATLAVRRSPRRLALAGSLEGLIDMMAVMFYRTLYGPVDQDIKTVSLPDAALLGTPPSM
ncbi:MAG: hypothetical protein ABF335_03390 [Alphaproteobacteria bacterium]